MSTEDKALVDEGVAGWLGFLLQTGDAAFPTGAYAHSLGLEEMVRMGVVRDEGGLRAFLEGQVVPALARFELPIVRIAREMAREGDLDGLVDLDGEVSAWKVARETREASKQIGARRLQALLAVRPTDWLARCAGALPEKHHAVVSGIAYRDAPAEAGLIAYFYGAVSGQTAAAMKLMRIGQNACQRLLAGAMGRAGDAARTAMRVGREELGWFNPLLDIASMRHETAGERLFIS